DRAVHVITALHALLAHTVNRQRVGAIDVTAAGQVLHALIAVADLGALANLLVVRARAGGARGALRHVAHALRSGQREVLAAVCGRLALDFMTLLGQRRQRYVDVAADAHHARQSSDAVRARGTT